MAAHFTLNPSCHCSSRLFHLVSSLQDWPDMVLKKRCCVQPLGPSCHLVQLCSAVFSCQLSVSALCLPNGSCRRDSFCCRTVAFAICASSSHIQSCSEDTPLQGIQGIQGIQGYQWSKLTCPCSQKLASMACSCSITALRCSSVPRRVTLLQIAQYQQNESRVTARRPAFFCAWPWLWLPTEITIGCSNTCWSRVQSRWTCRSKTSKAWHTFISFICLQQGFPGASLFDGSWKLQDCKRIDEPSQYFSLLSIKITHSPSPYKRSLQSHPLSRDAFQLPTNRSRKSLSLYCFLIFAQA